MVISMTAKFSKPFSLSMGVAALALAGACSQPAPPSSSSEPALVEEATSDFEAAADDILAAAYSPDGPGVAAIVTRNNETIYVGTIGMASIEAGTPITEDTVFRLASITKQIAAATLLLLVEDGLVDLDAPLGTYLPDYPEPGASIPVRHLLNHTSGIPSYTGIPGWMTEENTSREYSTEEMIEIFADLPAAFQPGEQLSYNNSGYVLVGAVIEAVTEKPWADVVKERIAAPLGLESLDTGLNEASIATFAVGYTNTETPSPAQKIHMSVPHAAGALVSDIEDIAAWGNALHDLEVLNEASYASMIAPTVLTSGEEDTYGFGIGTGTFLDVGTIGHNGGIFGFGTDSMYIPSEDVFVAVLGNSDSFAVWPGTALERLAALAIDKPFPTLSATDLDMDAAEPLFGVYSSADVTRSFFERDGQLFTYREGGVESEVAYAGDGVYYYGPGSLERFTFDTSSEPARMSFYTRESVSPETLTWSAPIAEEIKVDPSILETYLGTYTLDIPPIAEIAPLEGDLANGISIQLTDQPALPLQVVSDTEFAVRSAGATIRFAPTEDGRMGMTIEQGSAAYTGVMDAE